MNAKHTCTPYALSGLSSQKSFGDLKAVESTENSQCLKITLLDSTGTGRMYTAELVSESADGYRITFNDYPHSDKKGLSLLISKDERVLQYELGLDDPQNPKKKGTLIFLSNHGCGLATLLREKLKSE